MCNRRLTSLIRSSVMTDIALATPTAPANANPRNSTTKRSAVLAVLAVVVLGGATAALFALEACAENSPAQPIPVSTPTTTPSSSAKPSATPPAPAPTPPLPPPPT